MTPAQIAASLSEAQRKDFMEGRCIYHHANCLCLSEHADALMALGLICPREPEYGGRVHTQLGQAVRKALLSGQTP